MQAIKEIIKALDVGKGPKDAPDFMMTLVSKLFQKMEPVIQDLDERADDLEEEVILGNTLKQRQEVLDIRKDTLHLKRYISPQKNVISFLKSPEISWLDHEQRLRLNEVEERIMRYLDVLETIKERLHIINDEIQNALSDKMNRNTYMFSIMASIFLPLGFLTGLLGINVGGMLGANDPRPFGLFAGCSVA